MTALELIRGVTILLLMACALTLPGALLEAQRPRRVWLIIAFFDLLCFGAVLDIATHMSNPTVHVQTVVYLLAGIAGMTYVVRLFFIVKEEKRATQG